MTGISPGEVVKFDFSAINFTITKMSSGEPTVDRETGLDSPIPPLVLVPFAEEDINNHVIDEAFYSEATPNQEVALCEMPSTDPIMKKRGRPFKNKAPIRKEKGKPSKKRISRAASSPATSSTSISVPSTDSEKTLSTKWVRSLRPRRKRSASLGASGANHGKATGFRSKKRVQGGSAKRPLENRADETSGLDKLAVVAMAAKSKRILNDAYPGSSDIAANEPGSSEAVDVSDVPPQYHDLYQKISARYGRLYGNFGSYFPKTHETMTRELLETISAMMQAKPAELSLSDISKWENILKFASGVGFNIDWLFGILSNMQKYASRGCVTEEMVQQQAAMIQDLKVAEEITVEKLNAVQQQLNDLRSRITDANSKLEELKGQQLSTNFFGDLK